VAHLEGEDYQGKRLAAEALAAIGAPVLPAIGDLLESPDWERRGWGVDVLARLGARAPVPVLVGASKDPVSLVRQGAVDALAGRDDPAAAKALVTALHDEDDGVRAAAAKGLARYGRGDAVAPLVQALGDPVTFVAGAASLSLKEVLERDPVTAPLVPALGHPSSFVRQTAAELLDRFGELSLSSALLPLLRDRRRRSALLRSRRSVIGRSARRCRP
jgi:HEAT repeat protein